MDSVHETLEDFLIDYCEYLPPEIPVLPKPPTALEFLNNHVHPNSPFIIKPLGGFFPEAEKEWKKIYNMTKPMQSHYITVAATPDGRADSIVEDKFMIPEERRMSFFDYILNYEKAQPKQVLYVQKQNNNLIDEFGPLLPLLNRDVPWATEAFGSPPEAANIWMGDKHSFTSMHKDHYENIYFVVTGTKLFRLFPPISIAWMPYRKCPKFQWYFDGRWGKKDLNEEVTWIRPDLQPETPQKRKMMFSTKSYTVAINAGEALYLPAMWFHEVNQADHTISVNYWYDMSYEVKFPYFCLVDTLGKLPVLRKDASVDIQTELEPELAMDIMPRITSRNLQKHLEKRK